MDQPPADTLTTTAAAEFVPHRAAVRSPGQGRWRRGLANLSLFGVALSAIGLLAGQFGRWNYWCDLASHFHCQYAVVMLVLGVTLAVTRTRLGLVAAAIGGALLGALIPYLPEHPVTTSATASHPLRVVSLNVLFDNRQYQRVIGYLRQQNPDVIVLIEVTPRWLRAMDSAMHDYPYRYRDRQPHFIGIAIYSKQPLRSKRTLAAAEAYACRVEIPGDDPLRLIAVHTPAPMTRTHWMKRNLLFRELGAEVAGSGEQPRTILIGDLNCTPWSPWFKWLLRESGLRDSAIARGLWPTWYAFPTWLTSIPIDHALVGAQVEVLRREIGPDLGSDHRPLTVDLRLRQPSHPS